MRRWIGGILALVMLMGCAMGTGLAEGQGVSLYADSSNGNPYGEEYGMIASTLYLCDGAMTVEELAKGLSEWTGLAFTLSEVELGDETIMIDWSPEAALFKPLSMLAPAEGFVFEDDIALKWFMLDSLYTTIVENMGTEDVYYTTNGGEMIDWPDPQYETLFDEAEPYMGSGFYDGRGDLFDEDASAGYGELGYDDEAGYGEGHLELLEGTYLEALGEEYYQVVSEGLYLREAMTDDGFAVVVNRSFEALPDLSNLDADVLAFARIAAEGGPIQHVRAAGDEGHEIRDFVLTKDDAHSERMTFPSYIATWLFGTNEDTRMYRSLVVLTDDATLMYTFNIWADAYEDYEPQTEAVLGGLELVYVE